MNPSEKYTAAMIEAAMVAAAKLRADVFNGVRDTDNALTLAFLEGVRWCLADQQSRLLEDMAGGTHGQG